MPSVYEEQQSGFGAGLLLFFMLPGFAGRTPHHNGVWWVQRCGVVSEADWQVAYH
jgi:hypothetical protein